MPINADIRALRHLIVQLDDTAIFCRARWIHSSRLHFRCTLGRVADTHAAIATDLAQRALEISGTLPRRSGSLCGRLRNRIARWRVLRDAEPEMNHLRKAEGNEANLAECFRVAIDGVTDPVLAARMRRHLREIDAAHASICHCRALIAMGESLAPVRAGTQARTRDVWRGVGGIRQAASRDGRLPAAVAATPAAGVELTAEAMTSRCAGFRSFR
jgi:hypothetical protein